MNKDENYYYKTCDFLFMDNKEQQQKNILSEYGYNFDSTKRRKIDAKNMIVKSKTFVNQDFLNNHKLP